MKKQLAMEGESKDGNLAKNPDGQSCNLVHDDGPVLQPIRIRHRPIPTNPLDWKFVESELRFVLRSGIVLWALYLLSLAL